MEQETKTCPYCGEEILAAAKKCKFCGEWLNKDEKQDVEKVIIPCPVCGEMVEEGISQCPYCHESLIEEVQESIAKITNSKKDEESRSFFDYYFVEPFIKQYFKFKGRINRKHFWISVLIWSLLSSALVILLSRLMGISHNDHVSIVALVLFLGWFFLSIVPIWATVLRRMRDGDSELGPWGWWFYILPIPYMIFILITSPFKWLCFVPFIILLWWLVKPSDDIMRDDGLVPDEEPKVAFKKSDLLVIAIILILLVVVLCIPSSKDSKDETNITTIEQVDNDKEKMVVGKWHGIVSESIDEDDNSTKITIESRNEYHSDKTLSIYGTVRCVFDVDEIDYANTIILEYNISGKGSWSVEGNNLVEKASEINIDFYNASTIIKKEDDEDYIEAYKQYIANTIPEMRHEMLKKSRDKIVKLTEDELVTRDNEGTEINYTRIE
jgi:uncharacterized membrane protein YhaH (DUF805 family)